MNYFEISIYIPMWEFVEFYEEYGDEYYTKDVFKNLFDYLDIEADICAIYGDYYDNQTPVGEGDIFVFFNKINPERFVIIDTYRSPCDQCDLILFAIRCEYSFKEQVHSIIESIYGSITPKAGIKEKDSYLKELVDLTKYPKKINSYHNVYYQKINCYCNGEKIN